MTLEKELVFDLRSEGEIFGLLSLMGRDVAGGTTGLSPRPNLAGWTSPERNLT